MNAVERQPGTSAADVTTPSLDEARRQLGEFFEHAMVALNMSRSLDVAAEVKSSTWDASAQGILQVADLTRAADGCREWAYFTSVLAEAVSTCAFLYDERLLRTTSVPGDSSQRSEKAVRLDGQSISLAAGAEATVPTPDGIKEALRGTHLQFAALLEQAFVAAGSSYHIDKDFMPTNKWPSQGENLSDSSAAVHRSLTAENDDNRRTDTLPTSLIPREPNRTKHEEVVETWAASGPEEGSASDAILAREADSHPFESFVRAATIAHLVPTCVRLDRYLRHHALTDLETETSASRKDRVLNHESASIFEKSMYELCEGSAEETTSIAMQQWSSRENEYSDEGEVSFEPSEQPQRRQALCQTTITTSFRPNHFFPFFPKSAASTRAIGGRPRAALRMTTS